MSELLNIYRQKINAQILYPRFNIQELLTKYKELEFSDLLNLIKIVNQKLVILQQQEPRITQLLTEISSKYESRLILLDKKFKNPNEIIKKILKKNKEPVYDLLRYTIEVPFKNYISAVYHIYIELLQNGFKEIQKKNQNRWQLGDGYQGVNLILRIGEIYLEIQFHTPESITTKQAQHPEYKQFMDNQCTWIPQSDEENPICKVLRKNLLDNESAITNPFSCFPRGCPPLVSNEGLLDENFPKLISQFQ